MPGKAPSLELATSPNVAARWMKTREVIGPQSGIGAPYEVISALGSVRDVWYVDGNTDRGNDNNDGRDPTLPLATIGAAVAKVSTGDTILVSPIQTPSAGVQGAYSENVNTPTAVGANYVTLMGISPTGDQVIWEPSSASDAILDIAAKGWRISGFQFIAPASSYSIFVRRPSDDTQGGSNTMIDNCRFFGLAGGGGIDFQGAPYEVSILDCEFSFHNADAAITCSSSPLAAAYRTRIERCWFHENLHHIHMALTAARGFNSALIRDCIFSANAGGGIASTFRVNLSGGWNNIVVNNYMDGSGDGASAYVLGASDLWHNSVDDTAAHITGVPS